MDTPIPRDGMALPVDIAITGILILFAFGVVYAIVARAYVRLRGPFPTLGVEPLYEAREAIHPVVRNARSRRWLEEIQN